MPYPFLGDRQFVNDKGWNPSRLGPRSDEEKARDCLKYLLLLAEQRLFWEPQIDNIIAYVNHGRRFITDRDLWDGQQTGQFVYDDTAMLARNMLVDGMAGYMCSRNQPWFALEIPGKFNFPRTSAMRAWTGQRVDSYPQVQKWLQDCQDVMYSAFNRSNFYDINTEFISDGATCGTSHMLVEEDIENARINFLVPHFRECYIATNQYGKVDTNYRVYKMTLRQLAQKFGWDEMVKVELPGKFKKDYENNMHAERDVLHAIYPRVDYEPWRIDARGKRWESVWVYCRGGKILQLGGQGANPSLADSKHTVVQEGGYDSMPIITWRWRVNSDEVYGRGPAHDAFVSIAQLNQMGRTNLIAAQKMAEPPIVAYSDLRGAIQRGPDGITYMEANRGDIRTRAPLPLAGANTMGTLPFALEYQDRVSKIVNQHFHTDVFMMLSQIGMEKGMGRPVTEQIAEMQGEKAAILGTRVGNLQSEAFDPLINRVFQIEAGAGRIPKAPAILTDTIHGPVEVQYLGPLAQAQTRLTKVRAIQSGLTMVKQIAEFHPLVLNAVDPYKTAKTVWDAVGAPIECMRDDKQIQQIEAAMNKKQEQAQMAEEFPKVAKGAAALSRAPEAGSIVEKMMGGGNA